MKTIFRTIAFVAVAAAAITACNKEKEVVTPADEQEQVFTFAIGSGSGETRSILGSDENGRFVQFDSDDTGYQKGIGSIAPNAQGFSSVTPANGDTPATFSIYTKGVAENDKITVWYPYRSKQTNAAAVELVIPSEQGHKAGNAFDMMAMPMVTKQITVTADMVSATTGDNTPIATINFANLGSLLNFKVFSTNSNYASEKVKSITFNAKNEAGSADATIGGTFTMNLASIDPDTESTMAITSFTDGVSSIVTTPVSDAAIGTTKATALDLYMVVAPGTYKGTIVVLTDAAEYTYTLSDAKTLVRSGIKAFGLDLNSSNATREEKVTIDYVTLPWSYPSDWDDGDLSATGTGLTAIAGVVASGLGGDYGESHKPYQIKLDGTGDFIQVKTNSAIGSVSIRVKMIGGATTSTMTVNESIDGSTWSKVQDLTISGKQNDILTLSTTSGFNSSSRFVQLYFTKGSNVGLGGIRITEVCPIITLSNIPTETVSSAGDVLSVNYFIANPVTGKSVSASADVDWINTFDYTATGEIQFVVDANSGVDSEDRSGVVTVAYDGAESKTFTVNQAGNKVVVDYVTLDWDYEGGTSADLEAEDGVTTSGLGSDYGDTHAPCQVKFDDTGDYIQIKTDVAISTVSVGYKMIGGANTSHLYIYESADGTTWGDKIDDLTISGTQNSTGTLTTIAEFNSSSRFVKIVFQKGSNVGIGAISIHKVNTDPVIVASNVSDVAAAGGNGTLTYTVKNFTDDVEVGETTGCVTSATISAAGTVSYTVATNYTASAASGTIVLQSAADNTITKTVSVSQLGSSLIVSATEITIPAAATTATFTVTSAELGYNAVVASTETDMNLSISGGASGAANTSAQTVTVSSNTTAPTTGDAITLGTISVYRNNNSSDPQIKTITIKKAVAGVTTYTLSFPDDNSASNGVSGYDKTWTAKKGDKSWTITNFNNNNWNNSWTYIKCGSKNAASTGTIVTSAAITEAIKTVTIDIQAISADNVTSITLYSSSDGNTWTSEGSFAKEVGNQSVAISSPAASKFFKIEAVCLKSSNGVLSISKIVYSTN